MKDRNPKRFKTTPQRCWEKNTDNSIALGLAPPHGLSILWAGWDGHPLPRVPASACSAPALTQDLRCGGFLAAAPLCLWQPVLSKGFVEALSFWQAPSSSGVRAEVMHRFLGTSPFSPLSCAAPWWPRPGTPGICNYGWDRGAAGCRAHHKSRVTPFLPSHLVGWIKQIHPAGTRDAAEEITQSSFPSVMKCALSGLIKGVQCKCLLNAQYSCRAEHALFWGVCFKVHFSIYKPPTCFSSGSHQGHPQLIRKKQVQPRKSSDNLWEVA